MLARARTHTHTHTLTHTHTTSLQARAQQRNGVDTVEFPVAAKAFQFIVRQQGVVCPRGDELLLLYLRLCESGLVLESRRTFSPFPMLSLAVPVDDVLVALETDPDKLYEFMRYSAYSFR